MLRWIWRANATSKKYASLLDIPHTVVVGSDGNSTPVRVEEVNSQQYIAELTNFREIVPVGMRSLKGWGINLTPPRGAVSL